MEPAAGTMVSLEVAIANGFHLLASSPQAARLQAEEILQAVTGNPWALLLLGAAESVQGHHAAALGTLAPLAAAHPGWPEAQFELGAALLRDGRHADAIPALQRSLAIRADHPRAWLLLADCLSVLGDHAGAGHAHIRHAEQSSLRPPLSDAAAALREGRIDEADARVRNHLSHAPNDVAALHLLSEIAGQRDQLGTAESLLARCLQLAPELDSVRENHARVLLRLKQPDKALDETTTLLARDPHNHQYRMLKAGALFELGEHARAATLYAEILDEHPGMATAWTTYGNVLKTLGRRDDAIAAYRCSVALDPVFGDAWWSLANLKTFRFTSKDMATMRAQLARVDLLPEHQLHIAFALGKALEDEGDYAASFEHYRLGNAVRRRGTPYDAGQTTARNRTRIRYQTREFFGSRAGFGAEDRDPIFVVGLPRAGSTLVEQILSSHPLVEGTSERIELITLAEELQHQAIAEGHGEDCLSSLDVARARALGETYIAATRAYRRSDAPFFIDKMPNNFAHIGLIQLILPNARIIDARRHPMACCFSAFKQQFTRGHDFSYDLADLGRYYRDYVELMAHYDAVLPGRVHRVFHERLVEDTESEIRRLLDYCGLPFDDSCLRFFENPRAVATPSAEQVRQPIYREGLEHWRHYEAWLDPLKAALGPALDDYPQTPMT